MLALREGATENWAAKDLAQHLWITESIQKRQPFIHHRRLESAAHGD